MAEDALARAFAGFKAANDARLAALERQRDPIAPTLDIKIERAEAIREALIDLVRQAELIRTPSITNALTRATTTVSYALKDLQLTRTLKAPSDGDSNG